MRLDLVDGMRGHLLIGMLIAHISMMPGLAVLGNFHHHRLIGLYDAEFFVPISGFIIGYLYTERLRTTAKFYDFLNTRLVTIYKYYLLSAVPFLIGQMFVAGASLQWLVLDVAVMKEGGSYSDILPIYFYCFIILYALFWVVPRRGFSIPMAVSGAIYVASQASYSTGMFGLGGRFIVFDIAAWQFLFMIFLWVGARWREALACIRILSAEKYLAAIVGLAVLIAYGRFSTYYPTPFPPTVAPGIPWPRLQLHPFYLVQILAVCALLCAIFCRPCGVLAVPNGVMRWYFSMPWLRNVGRFSIQMFTLHVFIIAMMHRIEGRVSDAQFMLVALISLGAFIVIPSAWIIAKKARVARRAIVT